MLLECSTKELPENIKFINLLCRLGVSYHFEDEIDEQLRRIFNMLPKLLEDNDYELSTFANLFRVLRQYGYKMTCDVFEKFKGGDGEFKEDIANDVEGLLCLYEACFLAVPDEDILDEAIAFTRKHLENLVENSSPHLQNHIRNTLMNPSHRTTERLNAFHYISFYREEESADETLLKFAKMDYNALQLLYKKELAILSKWWKDSNVVENLPYARDRLIEAYMWSLGAVFEPQYSISRMFLSKYVAVATPLDDFYDTYGTVDEIKLLTAQLQRFVMDDGDELPEYIKSLCGLVFELAEKHHAQGCSCKATFAKEMLKELSIGLHNEAMWRKEQKAPSFDEYLRNGKVTCGYEAFTSAFLLGAENMGMDEVLWVRNDSEMIVGAKLHARFLNDVSGVRKGESRGEFPKAVDCYMIQYGMSEDEAVEAIVKFLENKWKLMNEGLLQPTMVSRSLLKYTFNYTRSSIFLYQGTDLFTYGNDMMPMVNALVINPIPM
ncbi:terpene synthase 5-like [Euphorbia lathyris]|uniref:terpene synthase 5-like n=1 Tax=Euphorbia lathyris TaxID=212925 RepID=UPI00331380C9